MYEQFLLFGGDDKLFVNYLSSLELHLMGVGTTRTIISIEKMVFLLEELFLSVF